MNRESINKLLNNLSKTKFRGSFHLNQNMKNYVKEKGIVKIEKDAYFFIRKRLAPLNIPNDGRQTPMKANSHPVFIAEHATATCCRGCLEKIHYIEKNKELTEEEINYIVKVIMIWIKKEIE